MIRDVAWGIRLYGRGVLLWRSRPRLAALGLLPGLATAWLFTIALIALFASLDRISGSVANALVGDSAWHDLVQVAAAFAIVGGALVVAVLTFVSVTSLLGQGVFDLISRRVDESLGPLPAEVEVPWWRSFRHAVGEGVSMILISVPLAIGVGVIGIVPVLGAIAAWILSATVGGWLLALEFTAGAFERRGFSFAQRRRLLRQRRAVAVGFGATAFLASSFAPLAVVTMPLSFAGGTHLARYVLEGPTER